MTGTETETAGKTSFTLADLLDYETQLARDAALSYGELEKRDRELGPELQREGATPRTLLKAWLVALRNKDDGPWPGEFWQNTLGLVTFVLFVLGSLAGFLSIQALMSYDGSRPVNIVPILGLYVGLQLLLLGLALLKTFILSYAKQYAPPLSFIAQRLLSWVERRILLRLGSESRERQRLLQASLQRFRKLHGLLLARISWRTVQSFGLGFFLGSLLTLMYLVSFHDFAFGWSTTLEVDSQRFERWIAAIASPFSWISPELLPSAELIEATQYSRFEDRYLGSPRGQRSRDLALTRAWWPFLALCIATYGLLPRLLLFLTTERSISSYLRGWPFADQSTAALRQRLLKAAHVWQSAFSLPLAKAEATAELPSTRKAPESEAGASCVVVRWFDPPFSWEAIQNLIEKESSWSFEKGLDSRGTAAAAEALLLALQAPKQKPGERVVVTVHDPWELPGEAFASFVKFLRQALPEPVQVYCAPLQEGRDDTMAPVPADPATLASWRQLLSSLHDPYVGLLFDQGDRR